MKIPSVLALTGYKGSGKDAFADYLIERYKYNRIAFADPLKDIVATWIMDSWNIPEDVPAFIVEMVTRCREEWKDSYENHGLPSFSSFVRRKPYSDDLRYLLQWVGTEYYRAKDAYFWVKSLHLNPNSRYVITDMRFQNESKLMLAFGAACVKIAVPDFRNTDTHQSEVEIDSLYNHLTVANPKDGLDKIPARAEAMLDTLRFLGGIQMCEVE